MTEAAPAPAQDPAPALARVPGRCRGFTLLEIMIALAIFAVGSICVLSAFAAAIALHMKREADVRGARVLEEARLEAQQAWDAWRPQPNRPLPPVLDHLAYSRDTSLTYSITFQPVEGQPRVLDGTPAGVAAEVRVFREGVDPRSARTMRLFLTRSGFRPEDMKESVTYEMEKEADKMKESDSSKKK